MVFKGNRGTVLVLTLIKKKKHKNLMLLAKAYCLNTYLTLPNEIE